MPVVAFKSFPLADKNTSWSFSGDDGNRLIERGGWSLFKQVHTWFDDSEGSTPENKSAYKLPHHKEIDNEVRTVWRGCTAAMSRLMQQNTQIPDEDRRGCYNHLSRHYREFDEEPPEFGRYSDSEIMEWLLRWGYSKEEAEEVLKPETFYRRQFGEPTDAQLEKINKLAKRNLSKEEVFVFTAKLAGDMIIPERYIKLSKPLLNIFKQDAINGVSLLIDHSWASSGLFGGRPKPAIAYGRTFDAYMKRSQVEGEEWELHAEHYIPRGIEIDGISTDSIIQSIETGTMFDTSIGWGADKYECSICSDDIRACPHWPGNTYKNEETGEKELCYVLAKPPGFLMENSLVFDGAYPTAGVLSQVGGEEFKGDWVAIDNLKNAPPDTQLFHVFSATKGKLYTFARRESLEKRVYLLGKNSMKGGANSMGDEKMYTQEEVDVLVKAEVEKAVAEAMANVPPAESYITKEQATEALGQEYTAEEVLRYAKEGITCHNEAVEEAIKEGVRAMGNDFPAKTWKKMLASMSIQDIREITKTWHKQAEDTIPAGRKTSPMDRFGGRTSMPDEVFKIGR